MVSSLLMLGVLATHRPSFAVSDLRRFLRPGHKMAVCAHRGDHLVAPENSVDAYPRAAQDGADFGEADLRMTKDGVIVLMHDDTVDRTTDGHGRVADLTFQEIRHLHFKHPSVENQVVPTFEELLDAVRGKLCIYMDIKAVHAKDVLPLLRKHRMERRVIAYLYSPDQRREWTQDAPQIPIISDNEMTSVDQIERDWKVAPFAITDGSARDYTAAYVAKFHQMGVAVVPDIQGSDEGPAKWQPTLDLGVDGLQTDHPAQLIAYLKERGLR